MSQQIWYVGYGSMECDDSDQWYFEGTDNEWSVWVTDGESSVWVPDLY